MKASVLDRKLLRWLASYLRPYACGISCAILLLCCAKGIEAFIPYFLGHLVDQFLSPNTSLSLRTLLTETTFVFAILALAYCFDAITVFIKTRVGQKAFITLREQIFSHILHLPTPFFDRTPVGQLMTRTIHDVDKINQMFTESVVPLISSFFLFISMGIAILWINWIVGLTLFAMVPPTVWLIHDFRTRERLAYREIRRLLTQMNTFIQEHFMGAHVIRHFGLASRERASFAEINRAHRETNCQASAYYSFLFAGLETFHSISLILLFVVIAFLSMVMAEFQAGLYFTYSLYALMFFRPLVDLAERINVLQEALAGAERVYGILSETVEEPEKKPSFEEVNIETIEFQDVWFSYKGDDWVLKGISFFLKKGEAVGVVGLTGAGKTTLFSLLLRFYNPQRGRILINGKDIAAYSKSSVRQCFSVVLQDAFLFSDTLETNIFLAQPKESATLDRIASQLGLAAFVEKFPLRWKQPVQEKGNRLSTGEQQIVSLMRALVYNRPIFLLDEATAHIDRQTEIAFQHALGTILETKTTLIIAHRLSTVEHVDRILVLQEGRVVEEGKHAALLKKKGIYEKLYRLSFLETEQM